MSKKVGTDAEINAMLDVYLALKPLDPLARRRVVGWAMGRIECEEKKNVVPLHTVGEDK